jgi:hypothetical protein
MMRDVRHIGFWLRIGADFLGADSRRGHDVTLFAVRRWLRV